jgi:glycerate-2-kinase
MNSRQTAIDIFMAGVESVKPGNLINRYVSLHRNILQFDSIAFDLNSIGNIYLVGAGKASALMAQTMESILGSRINAGHIVTKYGHSVPLKFIGQTEAGHPVPDENGIAGTAKILSIVRNAGINDLVICLISGGGSALLADVPEGCTLDDIREVNKVLLKAGANISEINCIRKHLSGVKGGQLAKAAYPAKIVSLILSDVIGDPLDVIASGPTAPDLSTFAESLSIIEKYKLEKEIPAQIQQILLEGAENKRGETLKESDEMFLSTSNLIVGTNKLALATAKAKAEAMGYDTCIITHSLEGDVVAVAEWIVSLTRRYKEENSGKKICLLFSGEPTVHVTGGGLGGRNQHLALLVAHLIKELPGITFLSGGTDGTDGPTDAAGAVVDSFTCQRAKELKLDPEYFLGNFDSSNFFHREGGIIITGPTQTNVMDLIVVLIDNQE